MYKMIKFITGKNIAFITNVGQALPANFAYNSWHAGGDTAVLTFPVASAIHW